LHFARAAARHRSGQRNRDRDHDGCEGRDLSRVRIDAGRKGGILPGRISSGRDRLLCRCRRQHAVIPFNASTPILYYNKNLFRAAGLDPEIAPKTWARSARRRSGCVRPGGLRVHHLLAVMDQRREFLGIHNLPISNQGQRLRCLDAVLAFNNPVMVRHIAQLAEWQAAKVF